MTKYKSNLRKMKIFAWQKYMKASPFSEEAGDWYEQYLVFAINYDFM